MQKAQETSKLVNLQNYPELRVPFLKLGRPKDFATFRKYRWKRNSLTFNKNKSNIN